MTIFSNISSHFSRMESATAIARRSLMNSSGPEADHAIVKALTKSIVREIAGLTETLTDEKAHAIEASDEVILDEVILDEIAVCFMDAADKAQDRRENPSEPSDYSTINPVQLGTVSTVARVG